MLVFGLLLVLSVAAAIVVSSTSLTCSHGERSILALHRYAHAAVVYLSMLPPCAVVRLGVGCSVVLAAHVLYVLELLVLNLVKRISPMPRVGHSPTPSQCIRPSTNTARRHGASLTQDGTVYLCLRYKSGGLSFVWKTRSATIT